MNQITRKRKRKRKRKKHKKINKKNINIYND